MARAPLSLKARAIGLLSQREHSRTELRRKLLRIEQQRIRLAALAAADGTGEGVKPGADDDIQASPTEATIDTLLDALADDGYLSESRFVESRVHARAGRFGTQRIQQELAQHGLRMDAELQDALRSTELERAREVWLRRFGPEPADEPSEQARQMRFLMARGFAADVVRRVLRERRR